MPDRSALVLVAVVPAPRDMEIARTLGWYRIPLRSAPKVIAVDYLAFYQPGSFGERRWRIEYAAPVLGHELAARIELLRDEADHPRAGEEYFKVQIGPLVALPRPIPAGRWKRLTFLYTTGECLLNARTVGDLAVGARERRVLWRALRERAMRSQPYEVARLPDLDVNQQLLAKILGMVGLEGEEGVEVSEAAKGPEGTEDI